MPNWTIYNALSRIALAEFDDIVVDAMILALPTGDPLKLRLDIVDGSILIYSCRSAAAIPIIGSAV